MCGFTGIINRDKDNSNLSDIFEMTRAIRHRGPDDSGIVLFSRNDKAIREMDPNPIHAIPANFNGVIGFNRLSILDLSLNGHQPMLDREKRIILAFNGEIYNAPEYKNYLLNKGYSFRSKTDTEVLLYLYKEFGFEGMLEKLNGMFAICLVDLNKGVTFFARDRLGIKPLYYYDDDKSFLFSSEVKSFLFCKRFRSELNTGIIDEYTKFGFIAGAETLLKNVFTVEPGHYLELTNGHSRTKKYWEIYNGYELDHRSFNQARDVLENKIHDSLRLQLLSDVKIGCQLSGGIDSSLITLITAAYLKEYELNSVSVLLKDERYSEEKWIDIVTRQANISSHKYLLDGDYFANTFKKATWHFDFPLRVPNSIGIFLLAEKAKEIFTVFLSGEGADELFVGYERFFRGNLLCNRHFASLLKKIPYLNRHIHIWSTNREFNPSDWYIAVGSGLTPQSLRLMKPDIDIDQAVLKRRAIFAQGAGDFIHQAQRFELKTWLVDLLMRQDKMTMANSIENRVPFLDHNLVDFARKLPSSHLVKMGCDSKKNTKIILKKIAQKHFGKKFTYRKKSGFALPLVDFFMNKSFFAWVNESIIPGIKDRSIYNHSIVADHFMNLAMLNREQIHMLWTMISFEAWAQIFLNSAKNKA